MRLKLEVMNWDDRTFGNMRKGMREGVLMFGKVFALNMATLAAVVVWVLLSGGTELFVGRSTAGGSQPPVDSARLVSIELLPALEGMECAWVPASASSSLVAAFAQQGSPPGRTASDATAETQDFREIDLAPVRVIEDDYATFAAVAVDPVRNE